MIYGVPAPQVDLIWDQAKQEFERIKPVGDTVSLESIYEDLMERRAQLWCVPDTAYFVTRIITYPTCKAVRTVLVAGEKLDEWMEEYDRLVTEFGTYHGCDRHECAGRMGWVKKLKRLGFGDPFVTLTKRF